MSDLLPDRHRGSLRLVLGGAGTLWVVHFAVVYLVAEWQCRPDRATAANRFVGVETTTLVIVLATALAATLIVFVTRASVHRVRGPHGAEPALMAWLLAFIFVIATLVVGATPIVLGPCT